MSCLPIKAQPPQVGFDGLFQFRRLGKLGVQFCDEALHLLVERFAVVFDFLSSDVPAGREDVAVTGDFGRGGGFAEAGHIRIRSCGFPGFLFLVPG